MNGPEHYRRAEALLAAVSDPDSAATLARAGGIAAAAAALTAAQVHATLALAAATAEPIALSYCGDEAANVSRAWSKAIS